MVAALEEVQLDFTPKDHGPINVFVRLPNVKDELLLENIPQEFTVADLKGAIEIFGDFETVGMQIRLVDSKAYITDPTEIGGVLEQNSRVVLEAPVAAPAVDSEPQGKCPFGYDAKPKEEAKKEVKKEEEASAGKCPFGMDKKGDADSSADAAKCPFGGGKKKEGGGGMCPISRTGGVDFKIKIPSRTDVPPDQRLDAMDMGNIPGNLPVDYVREMLQTNIKCMDLSGYKLRIEGQVSYLPDNVTVESAIPKGSVVVLEQPVEKRKPPPQEPIAPAKPKKAGGGCPMMSDNDGLKFTVVFPDETTMPLSNIPRTMSVSDLKSLINIQSTTNVTAFKVRKKGGSQVFDPRSTLDSVLKNGDTICLEDPSGPSSAGARSLHSVSTEVVDMTVNIGDTGEDMALKGISKHMTIADLKGMIVSSSKSGMKFGRLKVEGEAHYLNPRHLIGQVLETGMTLCLENDEPKIFEISEDEAQAADAAPADAAPAGKCPLGHDATKAEPEAPAVKAPAGKCPMGFDGGDKAPASDKEAPAGKCPFGMGGGKKTETKGGASGCPFGGGKKKAQSSKSEEKADGGGGTCPISRSGGLNLTVTMPNKPADDPMTLGNIPGNITVEDLQSMIGCSEKDVDLAKYKLRREGDRHFLLWNQKVGDAFKYIRHMYLEEKNNPGHLDLHENKEASQCPYVKSGKTLEEASEEERQKCPFMSKCQETGDFTVGIRLPKRDKDIKLRNMPGKVTIDDLKNIVASSENMDLSLYGLRLPEDEDEMLPGCATLEACVKPSMRFLVEKVERVMWSN